MSKYYAVRKGKIPGIYRTWSECKDQVHKFSGAIYKSFKTLHEAQAFISPSEPKVTLVLPSYKEEPEIKVVLDTKVTTTVTTKLIALLNKAPNNTKLDIYTDGSHLKHQKNGHLGYGAWCKYLGTEYKLSGNIDEDMLSKEYDIQGKVSNPTAEFIGFHQVLSKLTKAQPKLILTFHIDYIGVSNWMLGNWRTKESHIRKVKEKCTQLVLKSSHNIIYKHVSGHSGVYGNDQADLLARSRETINTFD